MFRSCQLFLALLFVLVPILGFADYTNRIVERLTRHQLLQAVAYRSPKEIVELLGPPTTFSNNGDYRGPTHYREYWIYQNYCTFYLKLYDEQTGHELNHIRITIRNGIVEDVDAKYFEPACQR